MKSFLHVLFLLTILFSTNVQANPIPYTQPAYDKLQSEGKPVVVWVHADWCPTCRAQAPIISALLKQKDFQGITVLRVDYDNQKAVVRAFRVWKQSTLIVFKGGREVGRSTGDTSREGLEILLRKAL
jgi:thiol-disulfide isomerase/thioredoxin